MPPQTLARSPSTQLPCCLLQDPWYTNGAASASKTGAPAAEPVVPTAKKVASPSEAEVKAAVDEVEEIKEPESSAVSAYVSPSTCTLVIPGLVYFFCAQRDKPHNLNAFEVVNMLGGMSLNRMLLASADTLTAKRYVAVVGVGGEKTITCLLRPMAPGLDNSFLLNPPRKSLTG